MQNRVSNFVTDGCPRIEALRWCQFQLLPHALCDQDNDLAITPWVSGPIPVTELRPGGRVDVYPELWQLTIGQPQDIERSGCFQRFG